jgi:hypothetical protein
MVERSPASSASHLLTVRRPTTRPPRRRHACSNLHGTRLSDPERPIGRLFLDCRAPPPSTCTTSSAAVRVRPVPPALGRGRRPVEIRRPASGTRRHLITRRLRKSAVQEQHPAASTPGGQVSAQHRAELRLLDFGEQQRPLAHRKHIRVVVPQHPDVDLRRSAASPQEFQDSPQIAVSDQR